MLRIVKSINKNRKTINMTAPAPTRGLMLYNDITDIPSGGAFILENMVCMSDVVRIRGGSERRNFGLGGNVAAIASYTSGTVSKAFAIAGDASHNIFDITSTGAVGAALVTGLTATVWSTIQFSTSGGIFLVACGNGNPRRIYDGSTWSVSPAITGSGLASSKLSQVWTHGNRQFFIENGTTNIWYLPVDSIGGVAIKFPLGGEFKEGGVAIAGASWTSDAGGNGLKSSCCIVSSQGEIAVYEGADPATWTSTGVYKVAKPCGINCFMKTGGDLTVMTEDGDFALSQIVSLDRAALVNESVSKNIKPLWRFRSDQGNTALWTISRNDHDGYAIINIPESGPNLATQFVANMQTGAWSTFSGWNASVMASVNDRILFGTKTGLIFSGEESGADDGVPYTANYIGGYKIVRGGKALIARMMKATLRTTDNCQAKVSALFDYSTLLPTAPSICLSVTGEKWNSAIWNSAKWGVSRTIKNAWQTISGYGFAVAPCVQYSVGQIVKPNLELIETQMELEIGENLA
jgi:hypothetical protein